jgi:AraC-like DNA-binding protein
MIPFYDVAPYLETGTKDFHINHWKVAMNWPAHLHAQAELVHVRHGALEVMINDTVQVLHEGDFAVAFPNSIHAYCPVDGEPREAEVLFYIINPRMAGDYADRINAYSSRFPFVRAADMPTDARIALDRLMEQEKQFHSSIAKAYLQILLASVWPLIQPHREESRDRDLPYQALQYVTEHFRQPITVESVARELCVSKNYLSGIFNQKLNMTFHQCLHFLRIELARDLLRNTDQPITSVLYECGYESPRTFNRVFVEMCGITPREYRRQFEER